MRAMDSDSWIWNDKRAQTKVFIIIRVNVQLVSFLEVSAPADGKNGREAKFKL